MGERVPAMQFWSMPREGLEELGHERDHGGEKADDCGRKLDERLAHRWQAKKWRQDINLTPAAGQ